MANEPTLRKTDIEDLEDRVTILEGGTPEPHSNTMTKPELEDLGDRITVLEGGTPGTRHNPMRFDFFTSAEERVEVLEEEEPEQAILVLDMNGGLVKDPESGDYVERLELTLTKGESINISDAYISSGTYDPPFGYDEIVDFTTTPDDESTKINYLNPITVNENTTIYALWHPAVAHTLTYDYNGAIDSQGHSTLSVGCLDGEVVTLEDLSTSGMTIPEGKEFGYWAASTQPGEEPLSTITMNKDETVYAIWTDHVPELTNITKGETFSGLWVKPYLEISVTDPIVTDIYSRVESQPTASFYNSGTPTGSIMFDAGSEDAYTLVAHISDSQTQMTVEYARDPSSASSSPAYETYNISGHVVDAEGNSIDLSTITRPIYVPLLFETPQSIDDLDPSEDCADFACLFFFKEDQ